MLENMMSLGRIGGQEDDLIVAEDDTIYALPHECEQFIREKDVNCFAPACGSVHGPYKGKPKLNFKRMEEIQTYQCAPCVTRRNRTSQKRYPKSHFLRDRENKCQHRKSNGFYIPDSQRIEQG